MSRALPAALALAVAVLSAGGGSRAEVHTDSAVVRKALDDELARSMSELRLGDEPRPYYLAYTISDTEQATVSATLVPVGSVRATTPWLKNAGRKCIPMKSAAVASGLPVLSKTSTASAISPTQLPSSLTVYAPASCRKPGSRSGASACLIVACERRRVIPASCVERRGCITGCTASRVA